MPLFEFLGIPVTSTPAELPWLGDCERFRTISLTIQNTGAQALTSFALYTLAHPNAEKVAGKIVAADWTTASSLVPGINGDPFNLAANASASILINCSGHYKIILEATSAGTTLALRGLLQ